MSSWKKTPFQKHREEEEAKKKREEDETSQLCQEFVESFQVDNTPGSKTFVRGGTINPNDKFKPDSEGALHMKPFVSKIPRRPRNKTETVCYILDESLTRSAPNFKMGIGPPSLRGGVGPPGRRFVGLKNKGNTCYVNSITQCLFHLEVFRNAINDVQHICENKEDCLNHILRALFAMMDLGIAPIPPDRLLQFLKVDVHAQGDPVEVLDMICDGMGRCCPMAIELFEGTEQLIASCGCVSGEEESSRVFRYITLLPDMRVKHLLTASLIGEECSVCKQNKIKKRILLQYPEVLVITYNRHRRGTEMKDATRVKVDYFASLSEGENEPIYELLGVIVHKGVKITSGHHLVYMKVENDWYMFSDIQVSCVDENELTKEARDIYMLVYRKVQTTGQRNFEEVNQSTENRGRGDAAPRQSRQRSSEEVNQSTENCVRRDVAPRHSRQRNSEEANQSTENRGRRYIAPRRSRQRNSEEANQSTENRGRRDAAPRQSRVFGEIRYYQRHIGFLLPIAPFQRMVRKIGHKYNKRLRYQPESLLALQEAAEAHLVGLFEDGTRCAVHAKRVTLMTRDLDLVKDLKR